MKKARFLDPELEFLILCSMMAKPQIHVPVSFRYGLESEAEKITRELYETTIHRLFFVDAQQLLLAFCTWS